VLAILGVAAAGLLPWLHRIPGFHGDEAWTFLRVAELADGARPVSGMTPHTGALHGYLVWPLVELFGDRVSVLRGLSVACAVGTVHIVMTIVRRLRPGGSAHLWTGLVLATSPAFILFGRVGFEMTGLGWLILSAGVLLMLLALESGPSMGRGVRASAAGLLLGVAVYNHVFYASVVVALLVVALFGSRGRVLRSGAAWLFVLALVAGWSPQLLSLLAADAGSAHSLGADGGVLTELGSRLSGVGDYALLVAGSAGGDLAIERFVAPPEIALAPIILGIAALAACLGLVCRPRGRSASRVGGWHVIAVAAIQLVLVSVMLGWPSLRFVVPLVITLIVLLGVVGGRALSSRRRLPRLAAGLLFATLVVAQGAQLYAGIARFNETGGGSHVFSLNDEIYDSPAWFIDARPLYRALVNEDFSVVYGNELLVQTLEHFDRERDLLDCRAFTVDEVYPPHPPNARVAVVDFAGPAIRYHPYGVWDTNTVHTAVVAGNHYPVVVDLDPHFRVWTSE